MRPSTLERAALLLVLALALCADGLGTTPGGMAALLGGVALAALLVLLAHRLPLVREHRESRPGVRTTRTASRKGKVQPIYSTPLFYRGRRRMSN